MVLWVARGRLKYCTENRLIVSHEWEIRIENYTTHSIVCSAVNDSHLKDVHWLPNKMWSRDTVCVLSIVNHTQNTLNEMNGDD